MRKDVYIDQVIKKIELFNSTNFWSSDPKILAKQWLNNFKNEEDKYIAAFLLDNFIFYNKKSTTTLFSSAYYSIGTGLEIVGKPTGENLSEALVNAIFTPVLGEKPNPTDSGFMFCRLARQHLQIPEEQFLDFPTALESAYKGRSIIFLDDIIGTGNQFISTWERVLENGNSFANAYNQTYFTPIYLSLIALDSGLKAINKKASMVSVCPIHILQKKSTIFGICEKNTEFPLERIDKFLMNYSRYLAPKEAYIANDSMALRYGFGYKGLMLGFEHSIPDSTLPIFWAPGQPPEWTALYERR